MVKVLAALKSMLVPFISLVSIDISRFIHLCKVDITFISLAERTLILKVFPIWALVCKQPLHLPEKVQIRGSLYMLNYKDDFNSLYFRHHWRLWELEEFSVFQKFSVWNLIWKALNKLSVFLLYSMASEHQMRYTMHRCALDVG